MNPDDYWKKKERHIPEYVTTEPSYTKKRNPTMNKQKLELMSMEQLSRLARNEGEDHALRYQALEMLNRRERKFFGGYAPIGMSPKNYVEGL
jgi:hypothetical protein